MGKNAYLIQHNWTSGYWTLLNSYYVLHIVEKSALICSREGKQFQGKVQAKDLNMLLTKEENCLANK